MGLSPSLKYHLPTELSCMNPKYVKMKINRSQFHSNPTSFSYLLSQMLVMGALLLSTEYLNIKRHICYLHLSHISDDPPWYAFLLVCLVTATLARLSGDTSSLDIVSADVHCIQCTLYNTLCRGHTSCHRTSALYFCHALMVPDHWTCLVCDIGWGQQRLDY